MSFDGNMLHHVTQELNELINTGRITKIYQLSAYDLLFMIHAKNEKHQLVISASPNYARIHLTKFNHERPETPPNFCMFLRKHLEGGIIHQIKQNENDRVIVFDVEKRNELGDKAIKKFIIEVTGRHANMIVADSDYRILESIKHIMPFEGTSRTIYPGAIYQFPATDKINPFDVEKATSFFVDHTDISPRLLLDSMMGFSPLITDEIQHRTEKGLTYKEAFDTVLYEYSPTIVSSDKDYFYYCNLESKEGIAKPFETVNDLLDRYYLDRDNIDILRQKSKDILKLIKNNLDKQGYKIEKLSKELRNTNKRDQFKIKGELIQANMYHIKKGDTVLKCLNYYDNTEIEITLDPKKDAIENMEKFFKKYKKLKTSIPHLEQQIALAKKEKKYFEELLLQLEYSTIKDIEEIKYELEQNKYLKKKDTQKKKRKIKPNYDTYFTEDGIEILVGKNNIQNEYITHKLAKHNEVWMHVKEAPGSHVVVRQQFPLSEDTIRTAAQLASYYSSLKHSSSVPVDYVEVRYIKKVPGRIGSFVTYKNNKTIYIDPDEDFIINLQKK
jgi:predicted ribosome quality control (RQC) complex YloA/Tae2 family protein